MVRRDPVSTKRDETLSPSPSLGQVGAEGPKAEAGTFEAEQQAHQQAREGEARAGARCRCFACRHGTTAARQHPEQQQADRDDPNVIARHLLAQAVMKLGAAAEYLTHHEQAEEARGIAAQAYDLARVVR